jgi:polygalacturonase
MSSMLQDLIDQAGPEDIVKFPPGDYSIDAVNAPLRLKSGITLDLSGVTLRAIPNAQTYSWFLTLWGVRDVTILNGVLIGERNIHLGSTDASVGGSGGGIDVRSSHYPGEDPNKPARNIKIQGTNISECFCDGINLWDVYQVEIDHVVCNHNRRQGLTVVHADGVYVHNSQFSNSGGADPGCGIDLENDREDERIVNVRIEKNVFHDNKGACVAAGSPGQYHNIVVTPDNDFDMKSQPIWAAGGAGPLGTPWWALLLNRTMGYLPGYRWWGYRTDWYKA